MDLPWTWVRQVHGAEVVRVDSPQTAAGQTADAAVTSVTGVALAVYTADCAPVVLSAPGAVGVAHAGWRGLVAGVVQNTVAALRECSDGPIVAHIGPCIRARCYEFGTDDLARATDRLGPSVAATTAWGTPALDVTAGLAVALAEAQVHEVHDTGTCTACSPVHPSWRARRDLTRLAAVAWLSPDDDPDSHSPGGPPAGRRGVGN